MNTTEFENQVIVRLTQLFQQSKSQGQTTDKQKGRVEGFLSAGQYLGVISAERGRELMNQAYYQVFGVELNEVERTKARRKQALIADNDDYLDIPAIERRK